MGLFDVESVRNIIAMMIYVNHKIIKTIGKFYKEKKKSKRL